MIIKKIDAFSMAKMQGMIGVIFGFISGIIVGIIATAMDSLLNSAADFSAEMGTEVLPVSPPGIFALGWLAVVINPIIYGLLFFVMGLISAGIYNLLAKMIGGIKVDLEYEKIETVSQPNQQMQPMQQNIR